MRKLTLLLSALMITSATVFAHGSKGCCKSKKEDCKKEAKAKSKKDCKEKSCCSKKSDATAKK